MSDPEFHTPADLLAYVEGIMAGKLGELARTLRAHADAGDMNAEDVDALMTSALEQAQRGIMEELRPRIEAIFRRL